MRKQDSDSTVLPGGRGQKTGTPPPQQLNKGGDTRATHQENMSKKQ